MCIKNYYFLFKVLLAKEGEPIREFKSNPIKYIGSMLGIELRPNRFNIAKLVDDQYFTHKKSYEQQLDQMEKMFSDSQFFHPVQNSVDLFSNFSASPVYYYNFAHYSNHSSLINFLFGQLGLKGT